ncbi:hypothetical protein AB835_11255 [Candidatus Endobugula sertula]|uniref:Uncharacterized protein n=1 Tax=Candidatus Endobugula sertula TaxID=62101 RepID=A0A1D2QN33_9GAMM|nr:hypothetical protein AB835_11255 [Candidatus Endobugula sertula]
MKKFINKHYYLPQLILDEIGMQQSLNQNLLITEALLKNNTTLFSLAQIDGTIFMVDLQMDT